MKLFCDCKTDEEKSNFFLSGRAVETGVIAPAISNEVAMAYHRCAQLKKENDDLRAKIEATERQEPVAWMLNCQTLGGDTGWFLSWTQSGAGMCNRLSGEENEKKLYTLPGAQAQPAPNVPKLHVGNLPTFNQDDYPALGAWWVQLWDGDSVFARVYGKSPEEAHSRASMLAAAPEAKP